MMNCYLCHKAQETLVTQHEMEVCTPCAEVLQGVEVCTYCHKLVSILDCAVTKYGPENIFWHHHCRQEYRREEEENSNVEAAVSEAIEVTEPVWAVYVDDALIQRKQNRLTGKLVFTLKDLPENTPSIILAIQKEYKKSAVRAVKFIRETFDYSVKTSFDILKTLRGENVLSKDLLFAFLEIDKVY